MSFLCLIAKSQKDRWSCNVKPQPSLESTLSGLYHLESSRVRKIYMNYDSVKWSNLALRAHSTIWWVATQTLWNSLEVHWFSLDARPSYFLLLLSCFGHVDAIVQMWEANGLDRHQELGHKILNSRSICKQFVSCPVSISNHTMNVV